MSYIPPLSAAIDPYAALEDLLPHQNLPRVLNSEDIPNLRPTDPQPLFSPSGDFNLDGMEDIAISGIYDLKKEGARYFLLVVTAFRDPVRYKKLFFREYPQPVFVHKSGTTGEGDPGDQAFAIAFCANCSEGIDFYWNQVEYRFDQKAWDIKKKRRAQPKPPPLSEVSDALADAALKIVGELEDIKKYVDQLKKEGRTIGVKVETPNQSKKESHVQVRIYEKLSGGEIDFDRILVDVQKKKILKRRSKK